MQLSYNLIKGNNSLNFSKKEIEVNYKNIEVDYKVKAEAKDEEVATEEMKTSIEDEIKRNYKALGEVIVNRSKQKAEELIEIAKEKAIVLEKEAYEKGYNQGKSNGYEDGYNEGLNKAFEDCKIEIENNILKSQEILEKANSDYLNYLKEKEKDILKLSIKLASIIAKDKLSEEEGLNPLIEDVLNESKSEENIIIKCNTKHIKAIEEKVEYYKKAYSIKGEIFVLEDLLMEEGNAVIEKNTGKVIVGLDIALKNIEKALIN